MEQSLEILLTCLIPLTVSVLNHLNAVAKNVPLIDAYVLGTDVKLHFSFSRLEGTH